jgi:hypothetical protein
MRETPERLVTACAVAGAALFQAAAIIGALHAGRFADPLVALLALQAIVAAAEAVAFRRLLPEPLREPRRTVLLHLWLACMLVPCVGGLIEVFAAAWGKWVPMRRSLRDAGIVGRPEFVSYLVSRAAPGSGERSAESGASESESRRNSVIESRNVVGRVNRSFSSRSWESRKR